MTWRRGRWSSQTTWAWDAVDELGGQVYRILMDKAGEREKPAPGHVVPPADEPPIPGFPRFKQLADV